MLQQTLHRLSRALHARLIYRNQVFTAAQLVARSCDIIIELKRMQQQSSTKSFKVALCLTNSPELFCWQIACYHLGITILPIIYEQTPAFIQQATQLFAPDVLIISSEKLKQLKTFQPRCEIKMVDSVAERIPAVSFATQVEPSRVDANQLAMVIFSSGTSGDLKGIMHSYATAYGFVTMLVEVLHIDNGLTYIIAQPMGHIGGVTTILFGLLFEGTSVLLEKFNIDEYMEAITRYQPTHLNLHTPLFYEVINYPTIDKTSFKNVTTCFAAGDDMPNDLPRLFKEVTGADMQSGYGMTETGIIMVNWDELSHLGSIGKKISSADIKICDPQHRPVLRGNVGEIWAKSPAICLGYYQRPDLNQACIVDGWFRTYDLAYQTADDYYWYMGRASSVMKIDEHLVYPQKIEQVLFNFPGVSATAVISHTQINEQGVSVEVPVAFLTLKKDEATINKTELTQQIAAYAKQHLEAWEVPQAFYIIDKLPLNLTGKIDRHALQKMITS